jgi:hypothetical protein
MRRLPDEKTDNRHPLWKKRLLLALSLMLSLVLGEVLVRIVKPGFAGFRTPQIEHRVAAGIGFEMIPNQTGYTVAERVPNDSLGFRGPDVVLETTASDFRILCFGESMT